MGWRSLISEMTAEAMTGAHPLPLLHHNDCLDKKYVPCRENILHHARKLEIFDVLAGYFLLVKSTQFMLPQLPPLVWEIRSDVFIDREEFNNMETQITFCN